MRNYITEITIALTEKSGSSPHTSVSGYEGPSESSSESTSIALLSIQKH
jgi:hypothetical protein